MDRLLLRRLELGGALIAFLFFSFSFAFPQSESDLFRVGYNSFKDGFYLSAIGSFEEYLKYYPDGSNADDAKYMLIISYYYTGKYNLAVRYAETLLDVSSPSLYSGKVYYWKGMALYALGKYREALKSFDLFLNSYKVVDFYSLYSLFYKAKSLEGLKQDSKALVPLKIILDKLESVTVPLKPVSKDTISQYVLNELGNLNFKLGNYGKAKRYYSRILLNYPDSAFSEDAVFYIAECSFYDNDYRDAKNRYSRLLRLFPATHFREVATYRLAYICRALGKWKDALDYVDEYEKNFPTGKYIVWIKQIEGDVLLNLHRYGKALVVYKDLLSRRDLSSVVRQKIEYNVGLIYKSTGNYVEALKYFIRASKGPDRDVKKKALFSEALSLYNLKRLDDAEQLLRKILVVYGRDDKRISEDILGWLADIYELKGEIKKAYAYWDRLINSYPDSLKVPDYYYRRGNVSIELGNYNSALRDFDVIKMYYTNKNYIPQVNYQIGYIYALKKEYVRALEFFKEALESTDSSILILKCEYSIASAYYNIGKDREAIKYFEMLIKNSEGNDEEGRLVADSYFNMGKINYRNRNYGLAANNFKEAAKRYGSGLDAARSFIWMGWCKFQLEDYTGAEKIFSEVAVEFKKLPGIVVEALYRAGISASQGYNFKNSLNYFNSAIDELKKLEASNRQYVGVENTSVKEMERGILYSIVISYIALKDETGIKNSVGELVKRFPKSESTSDAIFKVAKYFYDRENYRVARVYFEKIISSFGGSNREFARYWDAMCYFQLGNYDKAIQGFMAYLSNYPDGVFKQESLVSLGISLKKAGNRKLVEMVYSKTKSSRKMNREIRDTIMLYYALFIYDKNRKKSVNLLLSLANKSGYEDIRTKAELALANYYEEVGELRKAENIFEVISEKRSDILGAKAVMGLAKLFESSGRIQKAIENYLKVEYLYDRYSDIASEALYRLYVIYTGFGSLKKAKQVYEKLKDKYPESKWIKAIGKLSTPG